MQYSQYGVRFTIPVDGASHTWGIPGIRTSFQFAVAPGVFQGLIQAAPANGGAAESTVTFNYAAAISVALGFVGANQRSDQVAVNPGLSNFPDCTNLPTTFTNAGAFTITELRPDALKAVPSPYSPPIFHARLDAGSAFRTSTSPRLFVANSIGSGAKTLTRVTDGKPPFTPFPGACGGNVSEIIAVNGVYDAYYALTASSGGPPAVFRVDILPSFVISPPFALLGQVWEEGDVYQSPAHLNGVDYGAFGGAEDPAAPARLTITNPAGNLHIDYYPPAEGVLESTPNPNRVVGPLEGNFEVTTDSVARLTTAADVIDEILAKSLPLTASLPGTPNTYHWKLNPTLLRPGTYPVNVRVSAVGANNSPLTFKLFDVTVNQPGMTPIPTYVGNAADLGRILSPGALFRATCEDCGDNAVTSARPDDAGLLPTALGGLQIQFVTGDGATVFAPIVYGGSGEAGGVVPFELAGANSATLYMIFKGNKSRGVHLDIAATSPALFLDQFGVVQATNADGTNHSASFPAPKATVISMYATGAGLSGTVTETINGKITTDPRPLNLQSSLKIGGVSSTILDTSYAEGFVAGVVKIRAVIPQDLTPGRNRVVWTVDGKSSVFGDLYVGP